MSALKQVSLLCIGALLATITVVGVQRLNEWKKWPRERELTEAQVKEATNTVDSYLRLVQQRKWEEAYAKDGAHQYTNSPYDTEYRKQDFQEFKRMWQSHPPFTKIKCVGYSAYGKPFEEPLRIRLTYVLVSKKFIAPGVPFAEPLDFTLAKRTGQWKVVTRFLWDKDSK